MRCVIYIALCAYIIPFNISSPGGFTALDTHHSKSASGSAHFTDAFIRSTDVFDCVILQNTPYILLPETIAGTWNRASKQLWLPLGRYLEKHGQTLVLGAEIYDHTLKYDNCMIFLGKDNTPIYRQRVPVPISMWRPFGGKGTAKAHWLDDGRITFRRHDSRLLIMLRAIHRVADTALYAPRQSRHTLMRVQSMVEQRYVHSLHTSSVGRVLGQII